MENRSYRDVFLIGTGTIAIILGLYYNEWIFAPILDPDGIISGWSRMAIWLLDLSLLSIGCTLILFRHRIPPEVSLNMALVCVAIAFCYGIGEFYVRSLGAMMDYRFHSGLRLGDDYLHHKLGRSLSTVASGRPYHTNSAGFRDGSARELKKTKDTGSRLVILGDSFTEAPDVDWEDTYLSRLEGLFSADGQDLEILNAGVVSYAPGLHYRRLKTFLDEGFGADGAVMMLDISDIEDEAIVYDDWEDRWRHEHWTALFDLKPRFVVFVRDRIRTMLHPEIDYNPMPELNIIDMTGDPRLSARGSWTESDSLFTEWGAKGIEGCKEHILEVATLCAENDMSFALAIYPWPQQLMSNARPSKHQVIFEEFARENKLDFYDFFPAFYGLPDWDSHFIPVDVHWNEAGHKLVADTLFRFLTRTDIETEPSLTE
ncbi:MAG: hypothetical protein HOH43_19990 [Candidatus Latescibacteria bacterium]|nr:hypothetical protein [Candidatus Latescibacterota bacterium]